jgi:N-acyl-D-amino-acid deacylase
MTSMTEGPIPRLDRVLVGALVADGRGGEPVRADIGIRGRLIAARGDLSRTTGTERHDVSGLVVAPGFVDVHTHSDLNLVADGRALNKIRQGVTTEVIGLCGFSPAPADDASIARVRRAHAFFGAHVERLDWSWRSFDSFLRRLEDGGTSVNVAALVGHLPLREAIVGGVGRVASRAERRGLRQLADAALSDGAFGVSFGLIYEPGRSADSTELADLARAAAEAGTGIHVHLRNEGLEVVAAAKEACQLASETGASLEVSHLKASGRSAWGLGLRAAEVLSSAAAVGVNVGFDVYPYTVSATTILRLVPATLLTGGVEAILQKIRSNAPDREAIATGIDEHFDLSAVFVAEAPGFEEAAGQDLDTLARRWGCSLPEAAARVIDGTHARASVHLETMNANEVRSLVQHPLAVIASDGWAAAPDGPPPLGWPHPRAYGTFPRVLGRMVRERGDLGLGEAVAKMSARPAERLGLTRKGIVDVGFDADLCVFDPKIIVDGSTREAPFVYPEGMRHVLVNGELVIKDGAYTGRRPGEVLRHESRISS